MAIAQILSFLLACIEENVNLWAHSLKKILL